MTDLIVLQEDDHLNTPLVMVGLAQVTLYPSQRLQQERSTKESKSQSLSSDCMMLSLVGMCLDNEEVEDEEEYTPFPNVGTQKVKPYVPPPVTWSQPAIVVPPDETKKERQILVHGRVARALGIEDKTCVWFRFDGEKERRRLIASVDDRATFHVVIEADWNSVPNLRPVSLEVMQTQQLNGDYHSNATFSLTPSDGLQEGVLYFDGVCCSDGTTSQRGVMSAGLGYCLYSCQQEPRQGNFSRKLCRETKLVSSYRFLGRPFCPNHAEYAALVEGLEWLFRFKFSKVWIVGPADVIALLRGEAEDITMEIPQIQKANSIARHMIDTATANGLKVLYRGDEDDGVGDEEEENWEATELADTAIDLTRNATTVYWSNIREANHSFKDIPACMSTQEERALIPQDEIQSKYSKATEEWSLLDGEQVMDIQDEDFDPPSRDAATIDFNPADNSILIEEDEDEGRAPLYFSDSEESSTEGDDDDEDDEPIKRVGRSLLDQCMQEFEGAEEEKDHDQLSQLLDCTSNSSTELTGHLASSQSLREQEAKMESDRKITINQVHVTKKRRAETTTKRVINLKHMKASSDDQSALQSIWMNETMDTSIPTNAAKQRRRPRKRQVDDIFESKIKYEEEKKEFDPTESIPFASFCHADALELLRGAQELVQDLMKTFLGEDHDLDAARSQTATRTSCSRKRVPCTSRTRMQKDQYLPPRPPRKSFVV